MDRPVVLITCHHTLRNFEQYKQRFCDANVEFILPKPKGQQFDEDDMKQMLPKCDVAICGDDALNCSVLEAGAKGRTKLVIRWGIGTDSVDKKAAKELGIEVRNTPGVFGEEVADAAWALILLLARQYHLMHQSVVNQQWLKIEGRSITGLTLGVIGLGSIGQAILRRGVGFGTKNIGYDPYPISNDALSSVQTEQVVLDVLIERSDIVVLACNLTKDNYHLIDEQILQKNKPGCFIVNVARGPLVDNQALAEALKSGLVAGAGLDVFEFEPLPRDDPIRSAPNCVFGTHNGSNTKDAVQRVNDITIQMALQALKTGA